MNLIINNGVLEGIRFYGEKITHLEIPEGVTVIGKDSFVFGGVFSALRDSLETVVIPEGVTKISAGAFQNCFKLREITFPESLREIGANAFRGCFGLQELVIPDGVTKIGAGNFNEGVFSSCMKLKSVKLGKGLSGAADGMFSNCTSLIEVETAAPLTYVGEGAFSNCPKLKQVPLAENAEIGDGAFSGCVAMADENGMLILKDTLFCYCGQNTAMTIPAGVQKIGKRAFYQNKELTSLTIPEGVTAIGSEAFERCEKLQSVHIADSVTQMESYTFQRCTALQQIRLPAALKKLPRSMVYGCTALKQITLPETIEEIEYGTLAECTNLAYVRIPVAVKKWNTEIAKNSVFVPEASFGDYNEVRKGIFWQYGTALYTMAPEGQTPYRILLNEKMGKFVFGKRGGFSLKTYDSVLAANEAKLPAGILALAMLYRLRFPVELAEDRRAAFTETVCKQVKKVAPYINARPEDDLMAVLEQIGAVTEKTKKNILVLAGLEEAAPPRKKAEKALPAEGEKTNAQIRKEWTTAKLEDGTLKLNSYKGEDTEVVVPAVIGKDTVSVIGEMCFCADWGGKCTVEQRDKRRKIRSVTIPEGITAIESRAFWSCANLETVHIPDSVKKIGSGAFRDCGKLKEIQLPEGITQIEGETFYACSNLEAVRIPGGLEKIGTSAFRDCIKLEVVLIPDSVKKIGRGAFLDCVALKNLKLAEGIEAESGAFRGCCGLADENDFVIYGGVLHSYLGEKAEVTVPEGVKTIGSYAFYECDCLKNVVLAETVETVETSAFSSCGSLESVTFPSGVKSIGFNAVETIRCKVRGYTGSAAETYAKQWFKQFESIGILQQEEKESDDFNIQNGTLIRYEGKASEVVIPEGVKVIDGHAFGEETKRTIEKVVIPEGVEVIQGGWFSGAFRDCEKLHTIVFPDSLVSANWLCFEGTPWLAAQKEEQVYAGLVFLRYQEPEDAVGGELREVIVRDGTKTIGEYAFGQTRSRLRVVLPKGLQKLDNAFTSSDHVEELVFQDRLEATEYPDGWKVPGLKRCSGGVPHTDAKLSAVYKAFYTGEPDDTAWIQLYQQEQSWKKAVRDRMNQNPEHIGPSLSKMAELLRGLEAPDKTLGNRAAAFALEYCRSAGKEALQAIYDVLKENKYPALKKLEGDTQFMEQLQGKEEDLSALHPVEAGIFAKFKPTPAFENVLSHISEGVCYAGSTEVCAKRVVAYVVYSYTKQYDPSSARYISDYRGGCMAYEKVPEADKVAQALDQNQLLALLKDLTERYAGEYALPYGRYADEKHAASLLGIMREWENWGKYAANGRHHIMIARSGLMLNDTRTAMLHFDKVGNLDNYAAIRGTDAQTLRDTVLSEFGFDANREIRYDLGGNILVAKLEKDLQLSLFDTNAGKTVKSVPKKNADAALCEKAKKEISELKKNIKKVLTARKHMLYDQFLSGAGTASANWKRTYVENPVLNSMARLLVWTQDGKTFTLTDAGAVMADGTPYTIGEAEIGLAHPLDMDKSDLTVWQKYFASNSIKQPFEQIWEPVVEQSSVAKDRYKDCMIPYYRFVGQEKYGIYVEDNDFHNEITISFEDCDAKVERIDWLRHMIEMDHRFEIQSFSVRKFTRRTNHIIAYLDKVTVFERIKKDDVSIAALLPGFTLAQITEFIKVAAENNCTNVTAILLNYKEQNFGEFDPMEEFSLEL